MRAIFTSHSVFYDILNGLLQHYDHRRSVGMTAFLLALATNISILYIQSF